jgi:hypothetical protein
MPPLQRVCESHKVNGLEEQAVPDAGIHQLRHL